jgi:TetR/AcrR family transcriptional regulator, copper-responsive repressor
MEMKRKRGRPRGFDADAALGRATEAFRARGYAATSLDTLAAATGLARPSLYAAFGDKRAMYLAALDALHGRLEQQFDRLAAAALPLDRLLAAVFGHAIDGYLQGPDGPAGCLAVGTASAEAVADPEVRAALARILALDDARCAALLDAAGSPSPAAHGRLVANTLHALGIRARAGVPRAELERIAAECAATILRAA